MVIYRWVDYSSHTIGSICSGIPSKVVDSKEAYRGEVKSSNSVTVVTEGITTVTFVTKWGIIWCIAKETTIG